MNDITKSIRINTNNYSVHSRYLQNYPTAFTSKHNKSVEVSENKIRKGDVVNIIQPMKDNKQNEYRKIGLFTGCKKTRRRNGINTTVLFGKSIKGHKNQIKYAKRPVLAQKEDRMIDEWSSMNIRKSKQTNYSIFSIMQIDMVIVIINNRMRTLQSHEQNSRAPIDNQKQIEDYVKIVEKLTKFRQYLLNSFKNINGDSHKVYPHNFDLNKILKTKQFQEQTITGSDKLDIQYNQDTYNIIKRINKKQADEKQKRFISKFKEEYKDSRQELIPQPVNILNHRKIDFLKFNNKPMMYSPIKSKSVQSYYVDANQLGTINLQRIVQDKYEKTDQILEQQVSCIKKAIAYKPKYTNKALQYVKSQDFINKTMKLRKYVKKKFSRFEQKSIPKEELPNKNIHSKDTYTSITTRKKKEKKKLNLAQQETDNIINQQNLIDTQRNSKSGTQSAIDIDIDISDQIDEEQNISYRSSVFTEQSDLQRQSELNRLIMKNMFKKQSTASQHRDIHRKTGKMGTRTKIRQKTIKNTLIMRKGDEDIEDHEQFDFSQSQFAPYVKIIASKKGFSKGSHISKDTEKYLSSEKQQIDRINKRDKDQKLIHMKIVDDNIALQQEKILDEFMKSEQKCGVNSKIKNKDSLDLENEIFRSPRDVLMQSILDNRQKQRLQQQIKMRILDFRNQFQQNYTTKVNVENKTSFCSLFWKNGTHHSNPSAIEQENHLFQNRSKYLKTSFTQIKSNKKKFEDEDCSHIDFMKQFSKNFNKIKQIGLEPSSIRKSRSFHGIT